MCTHVKQLLGQSTGQGVLGNTQTNFRYTLYSFNFLSFAALGAFYTATHTRTTLTQRSSCNRLLLCPLPGALPLHATRSSWRNTAGSSRHIAGWHDVELVAGALLSRVDVIYISIVEVQKKRRVCPVEAYQDPNANMDKTTETWESFKQAKAKELEDLQQ